MTKSTYRIIDICLFGSLASQALWLFGFSAVPAIGLGVMMIIGLCGEQFDRAGYFQSKRER